MFLAGDLFNRESAVRALVNLKANGFTPEDLAMFSEEPVELPGDVLPRPSHMSLIVVSGAVAACLLVIAFVYFTQYDYPVVTGGMPIFSFWATGVVFYEMTMFGAITTAFVWFLIESGIWGRGRRRPAPLIEPGTICLRVECRSDRANEARQSLESAGAANIRTIGDAR